MDVVHCTSMKWCCLHLVVQQWSILSLYFHFLFPIDLTFPVYTLRKFYKCIFNSNICFHINFSDSIIIVITNKHTIMKLTETNCIIPLSICKSTNSTSWNCPCVDKNEGTYDCSLIFLYYTLGRNFFDGTSTVIRHINITNYSLQFPLEI